jgi:transposase
MEKRRVEGARLLREGMSQAAVGRALHVNRATVGRWARLAYTPSQLAVITVRGRPSRVSDEWIRRILARKERWSGSDLQAEILRVTGVLYDHAHCYRLRSRVTKSGAFPQPAPPDISGPGD